MVGSGLAVASSEGWPHPRRVSIAVAAPPGRVTAAQASVLDEIDDVGSPAIIELNRAHYGIRDAETVTVGEPSAPPSNRWYRLYEQLADRVLEGAGVCPDSHVYTLAGGLLLQESMDLERRAAELVRQPGRASLREQVESATAIARDVSAMLLRRAQSVLRKSEGIVRSRPRMSDRPPPRLAQIDRHSADYIVGAVSYSTGWAQVVPDASALDDVGAGLRAARMEAELDELALRASGGDRAALAELLYRIRGPVVWQCRARMSGRTIGQQTPEDVAQEVLIAVCSALGRFRPTETRWMAFVYGIVRSKVIDAYRAASRDRSEPMQELPDHVDDDRAGPEAAVLRWADRELLHELLTELPDAQREVLVMRVAMGYSAEETARSVGSTAGAVRVTQHRAMVRLRALLAKRATDLDGVPRRGDTSRPPGAPIGSHELAQRR